MHNHSRVDPNEFSSPEDFDRAIAQGDGRTIAANHDAVRYLAAHHDQIATIHVKDRKRDEGPNTPWDDGDTPIGEVLRMVRDGQWDIPTNIEYEYPGDDTVTEVRRCFDFCRNTLGA